jgi:hypothetical protein
MSKIIAALMGLLVLATPAFACIGDICEPDMENVGEVATSFVNMGVFAVYESGLWMNAAGEGTITNVMSVGPSMTTVDRYADFGYDWDLGKTVNEDMEITWSPASMGSDFSFGKDSWYGWAGPAGAEYYREAADPMVMDSLHTIGFGTGGTMDRVDVNIGALPLSIYTSLGLNQGATCEPVPPIQELPEPECTWCPPGDQCVC